MLKLSSKLGITTNTITITHITTHITTHTTTHITTRMHTITLYYTPQSSRVSFEVPNHWKWVGSGTEIGTDLCDWQVIGNLDPIGAFQDLFTQCQSLVERQLIMEDFEIHFGSLLA